jgi:hypothetical protein
MASYSLIILKGEMIAMPFGMFVILSLADHGTLNQLTAIMALLAIVLIIRAKATKAPKTVLLLQGLAFILLLLPIVNRLLDVPLELFAYRAFIGPLAAFLVLYAATLMLSAYAIYWGTKTENGVRGPDGR